MYTEARTIAKAAGLEGYLSPAAPPLGVGAGAGGGDTQKS
jgi:hypothetical protein